MGVKNKLKEIRMREYMINQSEFANYLDVPITTYSQWERGTSNPTLETSFKISIKLNRHIHDIWSYEE
ncbi:MULTISPECIES: helix-turn-helix domain-containing protein [unclassified Clostridium]|uniref:helix-turn-helix transcriptional regulator n=1 Tax=unclassified Clostridium TaxID=2614128 RepID=UPI001DF349AD|nr:MULTISPECIES: helix-turn-helix domain-containing protein [unclassified Clostridium]MBN1045501.1 helix-turn-helix domain-containing protein [Clostridium botulinum]MBN1052180.1 helix-turn-helix domain-containing protein [Clostridium botulinum]